jgi:hypothetical protein
MTASLTGVVEQIASGRFKHNPVRLSCQKNAGKRQPYLVRYGKEKNEMFRPP